MGRRELIKTSVQEKKAFSHSVFSRRSTSEVTKNISVNVKRSKMRIIVILGGSLVNMYIFTLEPEF